MTQQQQQYQLAAVAADARRAAARVVAKRMLDQLRNHHELLRDGEVKAQPTAVDISMALVELLHEQSAQQQAGSPPSGATPGAAAAAAAAAQQQQQQQQQQQSGSPPGGLAIIAATEQQQLQKSDSPLRDAATDSALAQQQQHHHHHHKPQQAPMPVPQMAPAGKQAAPPQALPPSAPAPAAFRAQQSAPLQQQQPTPLQQLLSELGVAAPAPRHPAETPGTTPQSLMQLLTALQAPQRPTLQPAAHAPQPRAAAAGPLAPTAVDMLQEVLRLTGLLPAGAEVGASQRQAPQQQQQAPRAASDLTQLWQPETKRPRLGSAFESIAQQQPRPQPALVASALLRSRPVAARQPELPPRPPPGASAGLQGLLPPAQSPQPYGHPQLSTPAASAAAAAAMAAAAQLVRPLAARVPVEPMPAPPALQRHTLVAALGQPLASVERVLTNAT